MRLKLAALLTFALVGSAGAATDYPSRPINFIVPFAPGGLTDIVARLVGDAMSEELKTPVVVQNKPGAGATIGTAQVARAAPDGYTVLIVSGAGHATAPVLYDNLPYDVIDSFDAVGMLGRSNFVLTVNKNQVPVKNLKEFLELVRKNPGKYTYSHSGKGSSQHVVGALFAKAAGVDVQDIPYRGSGLALTALMSGEVGFGFDGTPAIKGMEQLVPLAQTGETRDNPLWPDVPTMKEAGLPEFGTAYTWQGAFVPKGTPPEVIAKLHDAIKKALERPDVRQKLLDKSVVPTPEFTPEATAQFLKDEVKRYSALADTLKRE